MKRNNKNLKMHMQSNAQEKEALPGPQSPTFEQIRRRAQEIYEARGGLPGHDLDDWLQAETELKSGIGLRVTAN
jgi:hypothetical protein